MTAIESKSNQDRYPNMYAISPVLALVSCNAMDLEWGEKDQVNAQNLAFGIGINENLFTEHEADINTMKYSTSEMMDWIESMAADSASLTPISAEYRDDEVSNKISIGNEAINEKVFDDELVDWLLEDREELIDRIIVWAGEAYNSADRQSDFILMKTDLVLLMGLTDAYVWSSISTNMYVSPTKDTLRFNEISKQVLEANENL